MIEYCCKCKNVKENLNDAYCNSCRKAYNKQYNEDKQGYWLYMIIGEDNSTIEYIGKTNRIDIRTSVDYNGFCASTKHLFENDKWSSIKILDVTDLVVDDIELRVLENELINLYKPNCNKIETTNYLLHNSRLFELITEIHAREWTTYKENHKKIA